LWCESDFKEAFKALKQTIAEPYSPGILAKGETRPIFNWEWDIVGRRLIEVWSVVEYVAALILKNRSAMFPENINGWSKQIRRCITDRPYLLKRAHA
jgi:hypothetical protein